MTQISPFDFLVNIAVVRAAARRAELLDLPRRRSPKFDPARKARLAEVKSAEDLELDAILDEMEIGAEADVDLLLRRLDAQDDANAFDGDADGEILAGMQDDCESVDESCLALDDMAYDAGDSPLMPSMVTSLGIWPEASAGVAAPG